MDKKIEKIIRGMMEKQMLKPGEQVLVGVSGGADSICLLQVLLEWQKLSPCRITVVHVEHGIRGAASREDARWVQEYCQTLGLPCEVRSIPEGLLAAQPGQTLEEAARLARYAIFEEVQKSAGADKIAVAHNANDQAETVLMNLIRGSGVRGLGGILPVRGNIIRPLLNTSRKEIECILQERGLAYRTDATNGELEYTRNYLRLQILPELHTINAGAAAHISAAAEHLQRVERYLQEKAAQLYQRCVQQDFSEHTCRIQLIPFLEGEELLQEYVLRSCVEEVLQGRGLKDYTEGHIQALKRLAVMPCGKKMDFPGELEGLRQREGELLLRQKGSESMKASDHQVEGGREPNLQPASCTIRGTGRYEIQGQKFQVTILKQPENLLPPPEKKYTKWLAYDTINRNVCIRTRQSGDYLVINSAGGKKSLKNYLIDQKIPREERDQILLVAEGSHILWVVGQRISEDTKIRPDTTEIMKIQKLEE